MNQSWKKKFLLIWIGQFVSLITSSAVNFAIIIWLSITHGSAEILAWGAIAGLLPGAVIGPFAGIYIDRWDRKKTMIGADFFIAACTLVMSVSFYLEFESLFLIYLLLAFRSIGQAFHMPAMQAAIPMIAPPEELFRIAGINQTIQSISSIAGPALGALAITLMNIGNVLLIDIFGALVAIITLILIHIPNPPIADKVESSLKQVWDDMLGGLEEIKRVKGLGWFFVIGSIFTFFVMPVAVLFPLLTIDHFNGDKWEISLIEIVWGVGMLIGGALIGIFKPQLSKIILMNLTILLLGVTLGLSGYIPPHTFYLFVIFTIIGGIAMAIYHACLTSVFQEVLRPEFMGRVFSLFFSIALIPSMLGLISTGQIADFIGVNNIFILMGILMVVLGIIAFFIPSMMRLGKIKSPSE